MTTRENDGAAKKRRCAIYTRKSTEHGLDQVFTSLDAQRDSSESYVRSRAHEGWQVLPDRYEDGGYTGKDTDRPAFQRLMADVDAGHIDVIVVYKLDRLTRSVLDFARLMERLDKAGAAFVSITESFSTADPVGRLILHVLMSFAEFEREQIAARTRDKVRAARRRGLWTGGSSPYGYKLEKRCLVVDDDTAPLAKEIFVRYLGCESAVQVAQELNAGGHVREVRRGGEVVSSRCWDKNDVLRVLENPIYAGYMPCGKEMHEGVHQPLIDRVTWTRVQTTLERNRGQGGRRVRDPSYLLRGCCAALVAAPRCRRRRPFGTATVTATTDAAPATRAARSRAPRPSSPPTPSSRWLPIGFGSCRWIARCRTRFWFPLRGGWASAAPSSRRPNGPCRGRSDPSTAISAGSPAASPTFRARLPRPSKSSCAGWALTRSGSRGGSSIRGPSSCA
jgi:DNA invertase Pin-like site-specific DNA recombinase